MSRHRRDIYVHSSNCRCSRCKPGFFDALGGVVAYGLIGWGLWELGKRGYQAYHETAAIDHQRSMELADMRYREKLLELRALEAVVEAKKTEAKLLTSNGSHHSNCHEASKPAAHADLGYES